jgi:HD superfamily phosphohydrolase YqeK
MNKNTIKEIYHWHGDHTNKYMKEELNIDNECSIYKAIQLHKQNKTTDEKLIEIVHDHDYELFDRLR